MQLEEGVIHLGPDPLSTVFLLRASNSSLQNTVKPLL